MLHNLFSDDIDDISLEYNVRILIKYVASLYNSNTGVFFRELTRINFVAIFKMGNA